MGVRVHNFFAKLILDVQRFKVIASQQPKAMMIIQRKTASNDGDGGACMLNISLLWAVLVCTQS